MGKKKRKAKPGPTGNSTRKRAKPKKSRGSKTPSTARSKSRKIDVYENMEEFSRDRAANWEELSRQRRKVEKVLQEHRDELLARDSVTGVHVGFNQTNGKISCPLQYVLCIHVKVKRSQGDPLLEDAFDGEFHGVPTDIIEMSYRRSSSILSDEEDVAEHLRFRSVLKGGVAISRERSPTDWGTLGVLVYHFGQPMYLTNQHVVGSKGDEIRQPPLGKQAQLGGEQIIGKAFRTRLTSFVDCAILESNKKRAHEGGLLGIDATDDQFMDGELDAQDESVTEVFKIGAKTGFHPLRIGVVESIAADVTILGHRSFIGQILVKAKTSSNNFIASGDSGSVLIKKEERESGVVFRVVGLVHAQTEGTPFLVASHFRDVKNALGIRLHPRF